MRFLALCMLLFIPTIAFTHEIQSISQHVSIKKQNETGWQQDLIGKFNLNRSLDIGVRGTYLERFDSYEKRGGGFLTYKASDRLTLQAQYLAGNGNEILPEEDFILESYFAAAPGVSPYLIYREAHYSVTRINVMNFGMEIEKIPHFILIPQIVYGKATFESPAETKDIYNAGLRVIYYRENHFNLTMFGYAGKEASQGVIGESNILVDTLTGGIGGGYFFTPTFKGDLTIDHTDYDQLNTQFITTTLNLIWKLE